MNRPDEGVGQGSGGSRGTSGGSPGQSANAGAGATGLGGPLPGSPLSPSRIVHSAPGLGSPLGGGPPPAAAPTPSSLAGTPPPTPPDDQATAAAQAAAGAPAAATSPATSPTPKQIRTFGDRKRHEDSWTRTPNTTGTGAIHVKTFHGKLTDEAMIYLDQQVNEWLDAHPQYEVKFVSTAIGDFTGKLKEPHLIVQVWV